MRRIKIFLVLMIISFSVIISCKKDKKLISPAWVKDAVFYQIFPERFNNGDSQNDPTLASLAGSWPHDTTNPWQISPWTSDWYKLQPWEEQNERGFGYNAQRRRYGGDIQGIINKLDYLSDLGINAIYLNPVFHSPSLHKYDCAYYNHIDAYFGPDPQGDLQIMADENSANPLEWQWTAADKLFLSLIEKAHNKNIRIIIDGVFNHTGINFWAFRDILVKGNNSEYKDWYTIRSWDDPQTPENEFEYDGWYGVKELPELREDNNGLVPAVKNHIFASIKRWMDPNGDGNPSDGIDGWRLDAAEKVSHNFWKDFSLYVKQLNPQAYVTAEIFWDDWQNNKLFDPAPWLQGDQFDGVMNYRWSSLMTQYFIDKNNKISASQFTKRVTDLDKSYNPETRYLLINLMDSHDTDRLSSNIVNPDLFYDKKISINDNPAYNVRKPNAQEWEKLKFIATVQMLFPGPPMIYYGSEAGMWGADDPDDRKPMVWPEFTYESESANISTTERPVDTVFFDKSLFDFYKNIIQLRHREIALRLGKSEFVYTDDSRDILGILRSYQNEEILCLVNNSAEKQTVSLDKMSQNNWQYLDSGKGADLLNMEIMPQSVLLLKKVI